MSVHAEPCVTVSRPGRPARRQSKRFVLGSAVVVPDGAAVGSVGVSSSVAVDEGVAGADDGPEPASSG